MIWAGLFALGVSFGILVTSHGLPWWLAPVISGTMFAGSVESLLIGMFAASAPVAAIAVTTFLVNSRHLFYGLSFPLHRVRGRLRKAYSVFALCDEAYALMTSKDPRSVTSARILWTQLGLHASWTLGALAGGLLGGSVLVDLEGLEFILTALFVVLTMDAYRATPDRTTAVLAISAAGLECVGPGCGGHGGHRLHAAPLPARPPVELAGEVVAGSDEQGETGQHEPGLPGASHQPTAGRARRRCPRSGRVRHKSGQPGPSGRARLRPRGHGQEPARGGGNDPPASRGSHGPGGSRRAVRPGRTARPTCHLSPHSAKPSPRTRPSSRH